MKNKVIRVSAIALLVISIIFSCKKKDTPTPAATSTTTPTTGGTTTGGSAISSFTWTEDGGAVQTADSAFWTTGTWGTGVRASKGGYSNYFEINWATQNNTAAGSKALAAGDLTFLKGSATYTNSSAANLNVTTFASNQLSGNFTVSVSGGTITSLVGGFNNLPNK